MDASKISDSLKSELELFKKNPNSAAEFLRQCYGNRNVRELALKHTSNKDSLITVLSDIHDVTVNKNLKGRINRIVKRLNKKNDKGEDTADSLSSTEEAPTF